MLSVLLYDRPEGRYVAAMAAALQVLGLLGAVALASSKKRFPSIHTTDKEAIAGTVTSDVFWHALAARWIAIHLLAAAGIAVGAAAMVHWRVGLVLMSVVLVGAAVTVLAAWAWYRITNTFMAALWNYWRFESPNDLTVACLRDRAGRITSQSVS